MNLKTTSRFGQRFVFSLCCLMMIACTGLYAQSGISVNFKNAPLKTVLEDISRQSKYRFVYTEELKVYDIKVSIESQNETPDKLFANLFTPVGITYVIKGSHVILGLKKQGVQRGLQSGPSVKITGKVTDETGEPLPGVTIQNKATKKLAASDIDGNYSIDAREGDLLSFVSIGMADYQLLAGKGSILNVNMKPNAIALDDVVVTGYQTISKERAAGSFATLTTKQMATRLETNILDKFEGLVPGLFVNNGQISIRGISTLYGNQAPLYVVDGFPYEGDIEHLNSSDIVNVTILKDAAAASIYGARAANGVIVITTKAGRSGKVAINFNTSFFITTLPDVSYLNLMSSADIVDLQQELFNMGHLNNGYSLQRATKPKALQALYDHEEGLISDIQLNETLNSLKKLDHREQIEDLLLQNKFKQQYNLSLSGGNDKNKYYASINYIGNRGYDKGGNTKNVNINIKDQIQITKWLSADLGISSSLDHNTNAPLNALSYFTMNMPYEVLKDEKGELTSWSKFKSEKEMERLRGLGLYDETYNPLTDRKYVSGSGKSNYIRLQGALNVKFMEGLNLNLMYQTEMGASKSKTVYGKESYYAKKTINDAAQIKNGEIIKNVPDGGQVFENRGDHKSYTLRAQLNFNRLFAQKHQVTAIAGAERRAVSASSTTSHKFGYNEANLQYISVNAKDLANIKGTQSIYDTYSYNEAANNVFTDAEDRYISFYANAGYTYNNKYSITGSVRVDDSNLFGSDPKYRYLPMWSAGVNWNIKKESFLEKAAWLDKLNIRLTYGINGNVVRKVGPFLQAQNLYNPDALDVSTRILYPPNKSLRWEKTAVTNIGVDFAFLGNRLSGTLDYYYKKSTDLLGEKELDPTNAFTSSLMNYGSMKNQGVEVGLSSVNIRTRNFTWSTGLNVSYNKNKITEITSLVDNVLTYVSGFGSNKVGYPMDAVFNYRWAGLNPENGTPLIYDKDGKIIKNCDDSGKPVCNVKDPEDLVYSGTLMPTYTIGFNNTFAYKGLSLSIYIIANGGNVLRDAVPMVHANGNFDRNLPVSAKKFWRKPGDEKIPGMMPAADVNRNGSSDYASLWFSADANTIKADYIKVRNITLSYDMPCDKFFRNFLSGARLSFQVQNPFKWVANDRGLDPEAYSAGSLYANRELPLAQCYILGLDITF